MAKIDELRERLAMLNEQAENIRKACEAESRDLTAEEASDLDECLKAFDRTKADIDRLERLENQTKTLTDSLGRVTEPDQPVEIDEDDDTGAPTPKPVVTKRLSETARSKLSLGNDRDRSLPAQPHRRPPGNWHFDSLGQFARAVMLAAINKGGEWDPKLILSQRLASATTYGSEGVGADGGFAVPPDFRTQIMEAISGEDSLVGRCDQVTVSGNSFTAPVDMTTPWQTSGGIQAYWGSEAQAKTQTKPVLQDRTIKLNKCYALVPMTDELLEDANGMEAYLRKKAPAKIAFAVNLAVIQGTGVGQPLGILKSPALVSVAKETNQVADTLVGNNILKMYSRMYAPSRSKAVWIYNQDIEPQLLKLALPGTDNTGNSVTGWGGLVYMPPNGLSGSPYGSLMGRPAIPTQACETLGDQGDILFIDFSQYLILLKAGTNPKVDVSMHLWFDQDITAFRFVLRIGGMPWWDSSVSARDGSSSYSPFVALDDR